MHAIFANVRPPSHLSRSCRGPLELGPSSDLKGTPRITKKDILSGAICSRGASGENADGRKLEFRFGAWPTWLRHIYRKYAWPPNGAHPSRPCRGKSTSS